MLKLYDSTKNPNSRKIHSLANEIGVTLNVVPVDLMAGEGQRPEYLKINPNGKIPALVDGQHCVWESNAILAYLSSQYGNHIFIPLDAKTRSHMDQWLFWQSSHLQPAIGKIAMERIYKKRYHLGEFDEISLNLGLQELDRFAGVLNGTLADRPYVIGSTLTLADFAIAGSFASRQEANISLEKWEYLGRWLTSIENRPAWRKTL